MDLTLKSGLKINPQPVKITSNFLILLFPESKLSIIVSLCLQRHKNKYHQPYPFNLRFFMLSKTYLKQLGILLIFAMIQAGCSISASVESSSESISTSSESISTSSSSDSSEDDEEENVEETANLYEEDVAALTVLYIRHEKNNDEFQRQLTSIAQNHNINDWEQEESTYKAMATGLKRAGISKNDIQEIPYFKSISDTLHYKIILKEYKK
jgi:hypothetical protein